MSGRQRLAVVLAVLVAGCTGALDGATTSPTPRASVAAEGMATVVERIVDGDTLVVAHLEERVRLIGIDSPETPQDGPAECFGREAAAHLADLVPPGTQVRVVFDVERTDRYGRPLGHLFRADDGAFVNLAMVRDGYASTLTIPPNVAHEAALVAAQREAREAGRGLWGACRS